MHPQADQEVKFYSTFLMGGEDLERGSSYFSSFSLCFKDGDYDKTRLSTFLRKKFTPHRQRKSWLCLCCCRLKGLSMESFSGC